MEQAQTWHYASKKILRLKFLSTVMSLYLTVILGLNGLLHMTTPSTISNLTHVRLYIVVAFVSLFYLYVCIVVICRSSLYFNILLDLCTGVLSYMIEISHYSALIYINLKMGWVFF